MALPERARASTGQVCPGPPGQVTLAVVRVDRGRQVLQVAGEIDLATVGALRQAVEQLLCSADGAVVIDLSGVTFMDCRGVATLFEAVDRARAAGIDLSAVGSPACARLIRLTGLTKALAFYDHLDDVPH